MLHVLNEVSHLLRKSGTFQHRREIMRLIFGLFCCLGASLVLKTVDAVHYDTSYMQAPCDNSRNFTLGANGYQKYGVIEADDDGCYNPNSTCGIRFSVSSGYSITVRIQWIAMEYSDVLIISDSVKRHRIEGYITPIYSIYSTSNWMNLQFITNTDNSNCLGGFSLHYTSFHYGECSENEFRCSYDGRCIPNEVVCDSYDNCGDWSDEMNGTCGGLSTSTVTAVTPPEWLNSIYDHSYIQAPCDNSRNFTLGSNGYQRYGFIEADVDGCYNPHLTCRIRLSVSSGYYITLRLQWIAIECPDFLTIARANQASSIYGHYTPANSIHSTTNWMNLEFITHADNRNCMGGFRLYYTSYHYGECSENEFRCSLDGRCIPNEVVCDSYDNCGDWSDEWAETCGGLNLGAFGIRRTDWSSQVHRRSTRLHQHQQHLRGSGSDPPTTLPVDIHNNSVRQQQQRVTHLQQRQHSSAQQPRRQQQQQQRRKSLLVEKGSGKRETFLVIIVETCCIYVICGCS